jgi:alkanesulfonate monooxygenase SsuD/methylene tetrahydromethanopterin reductase-like flavin-dependent oxidoreductase (luciferase family)
VRWGVSRQVYVAESDARALAEANDAELWYQARPWRGSRLQRRVRVLDALGHDELAEGVLLSEVTGESLVAETLAFGSPATVARHIEVLREMGVGQVMCWMNLGGLAQDKVRRSMELFAREVMPRFR